MVVVVLGFLQSAKSQIKYVDKFDGSIVYIGDSIVSSKCTFFTSGVFIGKELFINLHFITANNDKFKSAMLKLSDGRFIKLDETSIVQNSKGGVLSTTGRFGLYMGKIRDRHASAFAEKNKFKYNEDISENMSIVSIRFYTSLNTTVDIDLDINDTNRILDTLKKFKTIKKD